MYITTSFFKAFCEVYNDFSCSAQLTDHIIFPRELPIFLHIFKQENLKINLFHASDLLFTYKRLPSKRKEHSVTLNLMTTHTSCFLKPEKRSVLVIYANVHNPMILEERSSVSLFPVQLVLFY